MAEKAKAFKDESIHDIILDGYMVIFDSVKKDAEKKGFSDEVISCLENDFNEYVSLYVSMYKNRQDNSIENIKKVLPGNSWVHFLEGKTLDVEVFGPKNQRVYFN